MRFNQAAADLVNVKDWLTKLSPAARRNPKNVDQLVEVTEKVLERETTGWVQRMENALAQVKTEDEKGEGRSSDKEISETDKQSAADKPGTPDKAAPASASPKKDPA